MNECSRGEYAQTLLACLKNTTDLPVPEEKVKAYLQRKRENGLLKQPILRVPPPIQALFVEIDNLTRELLKEGQKDLMSRDRIELLQRRLSIVNALKDTLLLETFPTKMRRPRSGKERLGFNIDHQWNLYLRVEP
jgi:hypothetical protein